MRWFIFWLLFLSVIAANAPSFFPEWWQASVYSFGLGAGLLGAAYAYHVSLLRDDIRRKDDQIKEFSNHLNNQQSLSNPDKSNQNSLELKTLRVINAIRRITDESRSRGWTYAQENVGQSMEDTERLMEQERRFFQNAYIEKCRNIAIVCKRDLNDAVQQNMKFQVPEEYYINPHSLQDLDAIVTDLNNYLSLISTSK